ncbi:MAG: hypothetical protein L0Z47_00510, partial [Actinobacteria bacterium]|nr:hypothetical protein [Actinomycetota bacterium]
MNRTWAASGPLVAALVWVAALVVDPSVFDSPAALLLGGVGLILTATVAVVGMVLSSSRWAYWLAWTVLTATAVVAVVRGFDAWWVAGVVASLGAAVGLVTVSTAIRPRPAATGPSARAVGVPLVLLWAPLLIGATVPGPPWAMLVVGLGAPLAAFLYARVVFGGLLAVRLGWPLLGAVISPFLTWPGHLTVAALVVVVVVLAWHPSVRSAFHPPREIGST